MPPITPELDLLGTGLLNIVPRDSLASMMREATHDLRNVATIAVLCRRGQCQTDVTGSDGYYDNENLHVEHQLLSIPFDQDQQESPVQECSRLTCLLFINTALWQGFPPQSAIIRRLITAIKTALERLSMHSLRLQHTPLLTWALFLGAYSSAGQTERPWFVSHLANCIITLGLRQWVDVRAVLVKLFYLDDPYENEFRLVWGEVERVVRALT